MRATRCFALTGALLGLLLMAGAAQAQDWKGRGRVQGIVTDENNKPLEGAKITAYFKGDETQGPPPVFSDKKGRWAIGGLATGDWNILVDKEGLKGAQTVTRVIAESSSPAPALRVSLKAFTQEEIKAAAPPEDGPAQFIEKGNAAMLESKFADARGWYEKALAGIEDKTVHPPILRGIARTYFEEGQKDKALQTLKDSLVVVPDEQDTLRLLVTLLLADGKEAEANEYKARIQGDFKVDPNSLLNLGIARFNENKTDEALTYFEQVIAENPDMADGYYYRGLAYLNKNKLPEAKADFEKLLAIDANHAKAAEVREILKSL